MELSLGGLQVCTSNLPNQPAQIPNTLRMQLILQNDDKIELNYFADILKGFDSSPQSVIYQSHYLCNQMLYTLIFQTINFVMSNNLSLKYQRFTTSGSKDIGINKFEFVTKIQFLYTVLEIFCAILKHEQKYPAFFCARQFSIYAFFPFGFLFLYSVFLEPFINDEILAYIITLYTINSLFYDEQRCFEFLISTRNNLILSYLCVNLKLE